MRTRLVLLAVILAVGLVVGCADDIVLPEETPLLGLYKGIYSVTRNYGTPSEQVMQNNILWEFKEKLFYMELDSTNNTGDCFCHVSGEYGLTEGVRLKVLTSGPPGSNLGCTSCEGNDDPDGTFVRLSSADTLILRLRDGGTFKEVKLLTRPAEEDEG